MIIKQISLTNFRIYRGTHSVYFSPDDDKNIFIISGNNGYGKTTFLTSLLWCLYGKSIRDIDDNYRVEIQEAGGYKRFLNSCLNRLALQEKQYKFSVSITFQDVNIPNLACNELEIIRSFDYENTTGTDQINILIDGMENELTKEVGPDIFINDFILPKEIAKFFFFDSEKIVALAELKSIESRRQLSRAYAEVLGIKKYEDLKQQLSDMRLRFKKSSATEKEQDKFSLQEKQIIKTDTELSSIDIRLEEIEEESAAIQKKISEIQEHLIRLGSSISLDEMKTLKEKKDFYTEQKTALQNQFKELLDLAPFAIIGNIAKDIEQQLLVEQDIKKNANNFNILKEKATEIISAFKKIDAKRANIDAKTQQFYEQNLKNILSEQLGLKEDSVEYQNSNILHDFTQEEHLGFLSILNQLRSTYQERLKQLIKDLRLNKSNYIRVSNQLSQAETKSKDEVVSQYQQDRVELEKQQKQLHDEKETLLGKKGGLENEQASRKKVYEELKKKIRVNELYKEKDLLAEQLIAELDDFILQIKAEKKKSLENRILQSLQDLMHKQNFIEHVEVIIEGDIIDVLLYNDRKEEINRDTLSKGEQQLYATSILRGLVEESNIEFPVFIDSPLQKFDAQHASNVIQNFYPYISKQVVLFPLLNKELSEEEYNLIKHRVKSATIINNVDDDTSELLPVQVDKLFSFLEKINQSKQPQTA